MTVRSVDDLENVVGDGKIVWPNLVSVLHNALEFVVAAMILGFTAWRFSYSASWAYAFALYLDF